MVIILDVIYKKQKNILIDKQNGFYLSFCIFLPRRKRHLILVPEKQLFS